MMTLLVPIALTAGVVWAFRGSDPPERRRRIVAVSAGALVLLGLLVVMVLPGGFTEPGPIIVLSTLIVLIMLVLAVAWVTSRLPDSQARSWAQAQGVVLTDTNRDFAESYVTEGHRLRVICGIGGAVALAALSRGVGITVPGSGWVWLFAGCLTGSLVGVVWSEAWLTRLPAGTRRVASLTPRRVRDYLSGKLLIAQVIVPVLAVGVALWAVLGSASPQADGWYSDLDHVAPSTLRTTTVAIAGAVVVLTVVIWMLQRHIVAKPRPADDEELVAVDDAVRSSSAHLLAGACIGIGFICIGSQLQMLAARGQLAGSTADFLMFASFLAAVVSWRRYGHRSSVVRRDRDTALAVRELEEVRS